MNRVFSLALFVSVMVSATGQVLPPRIFYSNLDSGPNTGGENNLGAYVRPDGRGFGVIPHLHEVAYSQALCIHTGASAR
jgi:hypothetical protein